MLALTPMLAIATALALLPSGPVPRDGASADLVRFAQTQLDDEFLAYRGALFTSCPYALGTYSFIELSGMRRIFRVLKPNDDEVAAGIDAHRELTFEFNRARYYWVAGKRWIGGPNPPALRYEAERSNGAWSFRADQHICARHEPQQKPLLTDISKL